MTIPQVVDGVTDADAAFMNQLVDAANQANAAFNGAGQITTAAITPALEGYGPLANMRAGIVNVLDYLPVDPDLSGETDYTEELQAWLLAAKSGGAGMRSTRYADGKFGWGDGTSFTEDTNLYRGAANLLKTDDGFQCAGTYDLPLRLGDYRLWVNPGDGKLYIKATAPSSATDGTVVGSQS